MARLVVAGRPLCASGTLRSRPGFAATVIVTLALGIGANVAIFSVMDAVLLRPLPFARPDRLVHLREAFESKVDTRSEASFPDYLDWRARNHVFGDLAGYQGGGFLLGGAQPATLRGARVTSNFFEVHGVRPMAGRTFEAGEDAPGAPPVVLLSYGFWLRQFGGDRGIVGRSITLDGASATVIGVLPESFTFARGDDSPRAARDARRSSARAARGVNCQSGELAGPMSCDAFENASKVRTVGGPDCEVEVGSIPLAADTLGDVRSRRASTGGFPHFFRDEWTLITRKKKHENPFMFHL
jgi:MacB-like periplasmic core domain